MGRGELLDSHVENGLILGGLLVADLSTPLVECLIPFEEQNDLSIIGDFVGKLWMFPDVPIELHPQEVVSCFENTQERSPFSSCRRGHRFKANERHVCPQGDEVQLFEPDDLPLAILHEDDIIAGFFAQVFLIGVSEPYRQGIADWIEEQLYFRFHISVPFLMTAVR